MDWDYLEWFIVKISSSNNFIFLIHRRCRWWRHMRTGQLFHSSVKMSISTLVHAEKLLPSPLNNLFTSRFLLTRNILPNALIPLSYLALIDLLSQHIKLIKSWNSLKTKQANQHFLYSLASHLSLSLEPKLQVIKLPVPTRTSRLCSFCTAFSHIVSDLIS